MTDRASLCRAPIRYKRDTHCDQSVRAEAHQRLRAAIGGPYKMQRRLQGDGDFSITSLGRDLARVFQGLVYIVAV